MEDANTKTVVTRGKKKKKSPTSQPPNYPTTLSSAVAAQNFAVFLKIRATTKDPHDEEFLKQAERLYKQAILVYEKLLPETHPDVYLVKHSLAELWSVMDQEDKANALRQALLDTFDPPSKTEEINKEVKVSQTSSEAVSSESSEGVEGEDETTVPSASEPSR